MRWQLTSDWPVGQFAIPAGTIIEGHNPTWNGIPLPKPLPLIGVRCLDQAAYDQMVEWWEHTDLLHLLHYPPNVKPRKPR